MFPAWLTILHITITFPHSHHSIRHRNDNICLFRLHGLPVSDVRPTVGVHVVVLDALHLPDAVSLGVAVGALGVVDKPVGDLGEEMTRLKCIPQLQRANYKDITIFY